MISKMFSKIVKLITNPKTRFNFLNEKGIYSLLPDKVFLKKAFKANLGHCLNLDNPKTFNEKLQWLKLYNHKPEYTIMVDKILAKEYVSNIIGKEYIIPTLAVWENEKKINFDTLPNQFVLKCNHNSSLGICICKDKNKIDEKQVRKKLKRGLKQDYYLLYREWPYKNVKRRIIAEKFMEDETSDDMVEGLTDYKFYCFNGEPKFLYVAKANFVNDVKNDLLMHYNLNWEKTPFQRNDHGKLPYDVYKPVNFEKMIEFSKKLSENIPFLRVDWYEINKKLYFGEMTFFPGAGFAVFEPDEWNEKIGNMIKLPINTNA